MNRKGTPENLKPWKPGQSGNPKGRPKGSRDEFNEAFVKALRDEWDKRGAKALSELTASELARIGVQVLSKESKVDVEHSGSVEHRGLPEIGSRVADLLGRRADGDSPALLPH